MTPLRCTQKEGVKEIIVENPTYVQQPLIQAVVDHLLGKSVCSCDGESATLTNWVMEQNTEQALINDYEGVPKNYQEVRCLLFCHTSMSKPSPF